MKAILSCTSAPQWLLTNTMPPRPRGMLATEAPSVSAGKAWWRACHAWLKAPRPPMPSLLPLVIQKWLRTGAARRGAKLVQHHHQDCSTKLARIQCGSAAFFTALASTARARNYCIIFWLGVNFEGACVYRRVMAGYLVRIAVPPAFTQY